jgi:hypothetical protein
VGRLMVVANLEGTRHNAVDIGADLQDLSSQEEKGRHKGLDLEAGIAGNCCVGWEGID